MVLTGQRIIELLYESNSLFGTKDIVKGGDYVDLGIKRLAAPNLRTRLMPGPLGEGLAPSLSGVGRTLTKDQKTFLDIQPTPLKGQVGRNSFDFSLGILVAWCNEVRDNLTQEDLLKMDHKTLTPGEQFEFKYHPDGDNVYYVTSLERVRHSNDLEIETHSKSTTGRVGCQSRGVGKTEWGELITLLQPLAFNLLGTCGTTEFSQVVVRYAGTPFLTREQALEQGVVTFQDSETLEQALTQKGLTMRFDTQSAYRAKQTSEPIDMDKRGELDWTKWFELIHGNGELSLDKKTLYLLGSLGVIGLKGACGILSKEQRTFTGLGGFGCLAGVIQDGFTGQITMEPYFNTRTRIEQGDEAGLVLFDKVEGEPPRGDYGGTYQGPGAPTLPKMFRTD